MSRVHCLTDPFLPSWRKLLPATCMLVQDSESCKESMASDKVTLQQHVAPPSPTTSRHASSASQGGVGGGSASSIPGVTAQQTTDMASAAALGEHAASVNLMQSAFRTVSRASELSEHELSPTSVLPPSSGQKCSPDPTEQDNPLHSIPEASTSSQCAKPIKVRDVAHCCSAANHCGQVDLQLLPNHMCCCGEHQWCAPAQRNVCHVDHHATDMPGHTLSFYHVLCYDTCASAQ